MGNEGSKQSTAGKNTHPFRNPKVISEANSEGKEDSQSDLLRVDQQFNQQKEIEKGDLNHRSSSDSAEAVA